MMHLEAHILKRLNKSVEYSDVCIYMYLVATIIVHVHVYKTVAFVTYIYLGESHTYIIPNKILRNAVQSYSDRIIYIPGI